ncbi:MAG: hypothetical protein PVF93_07580 [Chromatiaceae bacterium]|jgi:hypothetical protein
MSWACADRKRLLWLSALVAMLTACGTDDSPEAQLRAAVDAFVDAVEAAAPRAAGDILHSAYRDARHPDKRSAVATLFWYTRQHSAVHLFTAIRAIELDPSAGSARSRILVAMAGVPIESIETLVSLNADLYRFDVDWQLEEGAWRVISSRWQRADLSSL